MSPRTLTVLARIAALERRLTREAAAHRIDRALIQHLTNARTRPKRS